MRITAYRYTWPGHDIPPLVSLSPDRAGETGRRAEVTVELDPGYELGTTFHGQCPIVCCPDGRQRLLMDVIRSGNARVVDPAEFTAEDAEEAAEGAQRGGRP